MSRSSSTLPFFVIFTASGFAGLIYESIWSHYLKLFLGHAAYAQTLVLAIFMGGMAVGSWLCSRFSHRWPRLLRGYALAEAAIGIAALVFHPLYASFLDLAYEVLIPWVGSGTAVTVAKWGLSGLLILPQSILLGMTFPLMTSGLIRRFPVGSGHTVATLYFTNSIGAAAGVLASGFLFIGWAGLPGTLAIAGGINLVLAATVLYLAGPDPEPSPAMPAPRDSTIGSRRFTAILLGTAAVTGAASFAYEIAWIRMLSLVLGSSTHAFELMLSAFIAGLAFGGLWIRRRIDRLENATGFLAAIQLVMGIAALMTLPLYGNCFEAMRWLLDNLDRTALGYLGFNLGSHAIALVIMLPATFCAGTTLPLITHVLLRRGHGERSIGAVYAWNTVGSILGVVLAVHLALPLLGLKGLLAAGASLDLALGLGLAWWVWGDRRILVVATVSTVAIFAAVLAGVRLDAHEMASGVYRKGEMLAEGTEVLFHRDGKTATVSVTRAPEGGVSIRTNGKPDAKLNPLETAESLDEHTMTLAGILALAARPDSRTAANIGFGSGLTTETMLATDQLERLDSIEIEPAMVEGARLFGERVARAFADPRSEIHFEDAKTFFSSRGERYDVIVSEPSNPWVSGVAGLFSKEFYKRVKSHLSEDGLLVQWLQFYEIDLRLVVSVWKALATEFDHFEIYTANRGDMIILASASAPIPQLDPGVFERPGAAALLRRLKIETEDGLRFRWLANRGALEPFLAGHPIAANSDYAPVLALEAARTRFLGLRAAELFDRDLETLPVLEMLGGHPPRRGSPLRPNPNYERTYHVAIGDMLLGYQMGGPWYWNDPRQELPPNIRANADIVRRAVVGCEQRMPPATWFDGMHNSVAERVMPFVGQGKLDRLWQRLESPACAGSLDAVQRDFIALWKAVGRRDAGAMHGAAGSILDHLSGQLPPVLLHYVVRAGMLGHLVEGDRAAALALWEAHEQRMTGEARADLSTRILLAHAAVRDGSAGDRSAVARTPR